MVQITFIVEQYVARRYSSVEQKLIFGNTDFRRGEERENYSFTTGNRSGFDDLDCCHIDGKHAISVRAGCA